jgi:hypothetical protein
MECELIVNLRGRHKLTGVAPNPKEEGYIFEIDGKHYVVYESEDDEYRSVCAIEEIDLERGWKPVKLVTFPPQDVEVCIGDNYEREYDNCVVFEDFQIINAQDKSLIFNGITEDWGDYYPYAKFEYCPENLPINK